MHREHGENDTIQLTALGQRVVEGLAEKPNRPTVGDDIIFYLYDVPDKKASCGELGMNIKITECDLKEALEKLERGGYVTHTHMEHHGPAGSYRGGMPPHEYLGQEVQEHAIAEPNEAIRRNLDDNYVEEEGE